MERRVTLRDIAKVAKVHVTTVSLALRNHPRLPAATRERIKSLAVKMGYRPDPVLASLMVYRQNLKPPQEGTVIGYLTGDKSRSEWRQQSSLLQIFEGAKSRAEECGYRLEEFWLKEPGMSLTRWNKLFLARGIEAFLVAPWLRGRAHLRLDWARFYTVKIGHSLVFPPLHTVENNQYQCMQLCVRRLRGNGYRRIGFANRDLEDERLNHLYKAAFLIEQDRCSPAEKIPPLIPKIWNRKQFAAWYQRHRPEVVICPDPEAIEWMHAMNLKIPEDIGFANLDCLDAEARQSGIRQSHQEVGVAATDLLISLIHRNERGFPPAPHLTQVEGRWVEGETTRRVAWSHQKKPGRLSPPPKKNAQKESR